MAPLPPRVGMSVAAVAPQSKAKSSERSAHCKASLGFMNGGCTRMNTRRSMSCARRKVAALGKLLQGHAFVEPGQNVGVNGFEPHGDFQAAAQAVAESQDFSSVRAG